MVCSLCHKIWLSSSNSKEEMINLYPDWTLYLTKHVPFGPHSVKVLTFVFQDYFDCTDEPSQQIPFMYHYANRPGLSTQRSRQVIAQFFNTSVDGLPGNDGTLLLILSKINHYIDYICQILVSQSSRIHTLNANSLLSRCYGKLCGLLSGWDVSCARY